MNCRFWSAFCSSVSGRWCAPSCFEDNFRSAMSPAQVEASRKIKEDWRKTSSKLCVARVALMFVLKPLVLASSTDEARVGNHPPHGRGRDSRAHLITGQCGHDNQLPEIERRPPINPSGVRKIATWSVRKSGKVDPFCDSCIAQVVYVNSQTSFTTVYSLQELNNLHFLICSFYFICTDFIFGGTIPFKISMAPLHHVMYDEVCLVCLRLI